MVSVVLPHHSYEVVVAPGSLARIGSIVGDLVAADRCALLTDANVAGLHLDPVVESLRTAGCDPMIATLPSGEANKNLDTVRALYNQLLEARLERRSPVIALGGGVTGDTVGFVAATYLRGVPFVQCPTTLLAMVDSSVGGKVGVNVAQGKNLIGAFHQPIVVVADPLTLQTLPPREVRCGLAECIKHAIIGDESLLCFIEENATAILDVDADTIGDLVERNVAIKAAIVAQDEREAGVRAHLNLGHTFAHAIEATSGYGRIQHGEAVGLGLIAAATVAADDGTCSADVPRRIVALLDRLELVRAADLVADDELFAAMQLDKKVRDNKIRFVLPTKVGGVVVRDDVSRRAIDAGWRAIRA